LKIIALRPKGFIQTAARNFESATAEESRIIWYLGAFAWTLPENPSAAKPENETQVLYRGAADASVWSEDHDRTERDWTEDDD